MIRQDNDIYYFETPISEDVVMKHRFNYALYMEYYKLKSKGMIKDRSIPNHPAIGVVFKQPDTGELCIIEKVSLHWHFGYYEHIVYRKHNTRSHGTMVMKNISSADESVIESAMEFSQCKILSFEEIPVEHLKPELW